MSRRRRTSRPATTRRRKRPARAKIPGRRRRTPRTTAAPRTPAAVTHRRLPSAAPARPIRSSKAWTPTAPRIPLTRPPIGPACERRASDRHGLPDQARKRQEPTRVAESSAHFRTYEARDHRSRAFFVAHRSQKRRRRQRHAATEEFVAVPRAHAGERSPRGARGGARLESVALLPFREANPM